MLFSVLLTDAGQTGRLSSKHILDVKFVRRIVQLAAVRMYNATSSRNILPKIKASSNALSNLIPLVSHCLSVECGVLEIQLYIFRFVWANVKK
jgi:hypothetical protein